MITSANMQTWMEKFHKAAYLDEKLQIINGLHREKESVFYRPNLLIGYQNTHGQPLIHVYICNSECI